MVFSLKYKRYAIYPYKKLEIFCHLCKKFLKFEIKLIWV